MNSVVPIANPPSASANSAAPTWVARAGRWTELTVWVTTPWSTTPTTADSPVGDNRDVRLITDDERRARLGRRHLLAEPAGSPDEVAHALVGVHGTDPATTVQAILARSTATLDDVQDALYRTRTLVRVLAMRRTVFAVPREQVTTVWAAGADTVAREQRRMLGKLLTDSGVTDDPAPWIAHAEAAAIELFGDRADVTSADLSAADPLLATRLHVGSGAYVSSPTVASRLLTMLSAEGRVVRAEPRGGWTSMQFRWATTEAWCGDLGDLPPADEAAAVLAGRWLRRYGPAHEDDVQWWFGWTKTRTRAALAALDLVRVEMADRTGVVLADDVEPVDAPEPWVALLPALDPSTMAWKHRDFVLGARRADVFDGNGNGGPTVWVDGRVVGGWAHRDDGEVAVEMFEDVGTEASEQIAARADALSTTLGEVRLKARARRWTASEQRLRA